MAVRLAAAFVATAIIASIQRLLAMVFVLNFDVAGPNATAAMAGLLITAPMAWIPLRSKYHLRAASAVVIAGSLLAWMGPPVLASLGAAATLLAATTLWRRTGTPDAAITGAIIWIATTALLGGISAWTIAPWLVVAFASATWFVTPADHAPAGTWAFLVLQALFLATPTAWRWLDVDPTLATAAVTIGLAIGLASRDAAPRLEWCTALLLSGMAGALWFPILAVPGLFAAQLGAAWMLRDAGGVGRLAAIQAVGVVFVFLHVVAGNWAFVGFVPEALSHGTAAVYVLLTAALVPVAVWRST